MKKDRKLFAAALAVRSGVERLVELYQDETERIIAGETAGRFSETLAEVSGEIDEIREFLGEAVEQLEELADHVNDAIARAEQDDIEDTYRAIGVKMRKGEW